MPFDKSDNQTYESKAVRGRTNGRWVWYIMLPLISAWIAFPWFMIWITASPAYFLHDFIVSHWK